MLEDKVAVITGSVGGIGFATARALAENGCSIMLNGFAERSIIEERLERLKTEYGVRAAYHGADLRKPQEIEQLVQATADMLGSVDIVVNNAAVRHFGPIEEFRTEDWDESLAVNLSAPFHMVRAALPHMKARGWGRIVNISSAFGFFAAPERIDYITTKTALLGLTRAVAIEVVKTEITCNAICPGTVLTAAVDTRVVQLMEDQALSRDDAVRKFMEHRTPAGRFVDENSVAAMVAFVCGPHSRDINGAALPVDAGWTSGR